MNTKIFFDSRVRFFLPLLLTLFLIGACGGGGGNGGSSSGEGSTNGSGNGGNTGGTVTYTTAEGMPIFTNYRAGVNSPLITLNLSGGGKMELDIDFIGVSLTWRSNGGDWTIATTDGAPGSSVAFANGYTLLYTGRGDATITTPRGESLRFFFDVLGSKLVYSGPSATFIGEVQANNPGNIWLTINGVNYGALRYKLGMIDPPPGDRVGYSTEGGHKWGFDIQ